MFHPQKTVANAAAAVKRELKKLSRSSGDFDAGRHFRGQGNFAFLLKPMRMGRTVDQVYATAKHLHPDPNDLIHKAAGWALREAGKIDSTRLGICAHTFARFPERRSATRSSGSATRSGASCW